jgi:hypothetical protein
MKTIELLAVNPSVEELLDLARKESGLRLTRSGQSIAGIIPMIEQPRKRIAPLHPGAWQVREDFDQPLPLAIQRFNAFSFQLSAFPACFHNSCQFA